MKIGIDISLLQTAHRRRGIGYTLINFINHLPVDAKKQHSFVFYHYSLDKEDPTELLKLDGVDYELRAIEPLKLYDTGGKGRLGLALGFVNQLRTFKDVFLGDSRIKDVKDLDYFLQFDQNQPLPSRLKVNSAQVIYDIIPYVMKYDYLPSYKITRAMGRSRKNSLKQQARRSLYYWRTKLVTKRARKLIAISEHTKHDFIKHIATRPGRISVCHLGVSDAPEEVVTQPNLKRYLRTSWGPMPKPVSLHNEHFLLFVGGADERRKLTDLVAAFNMLRAQGANIKLVLAGDTMQGPDSTPNKELSSYFHHTSYLDDIYFLSFVTDNQREWLYENALAFVYPSVYEGFGLPVIEAMLRGTPVITYKNTSIYEIAGDAALYSHDSIGIYEQVNRLLENKALQEEYQKSGKSQAKKFSWSETSKQFLRIIDSI